MVEKTQLIYENLGFTSTLILQSFPFCKYFYNPLAASDSAYVSTFRHSWQLVGPTLTYILSRYKWPVLGFIVSNY